MWRSGGVLTGWLDELRVRRVAGSMWCDFCKKQPRTVLEDGEGRFCSEHCLEEAHWMHDIR